LKLFFVSANTLSILKKVLVHPRSTPFRLVKSSLSTIIACPHSRENVRMAGGALSPEFPWRWIAAADFLNKRALRTVEIKMKTKTAKSIGGIARALSVGAITSVIGLSTAAASRPHDNYRFGQRAARQQQHVDQGMRSGALTQAETNHVKSYESNLASRVQSARAANGGQLTTAERKRVVKAQDAAGQKINQLKNNQYTRGQLDRTADRQRSHVQEGISSGQLTPTEAAQIRQHEQNMQAQVQSAKQANGGTLSASDRAHAERAQQDAAQHIYELKHNQDNPGQQ
jgi:hypothetical protein